MVQLPDFSRSFEYENKYCRASDVNRMTKVTAHYELHKLMLDISGANAAVKEFLAGKNVVVKRMPFDVTPRHIVKL